MPSEDEILEIARRFLKEEVAPHAQKMDLDRDVLKAAVDGLCRLNLMALKRPDAFGGPNLSDAGIRHFQEEIARYSGALAFLQTQHQGVVGMIASSDNSWLKETYLPGMANGEKLVGVGFSQLRRPGPPIMRAERVDGGYRLNGFVPWVTGWSFFPEFMIGASLEDGRALFGLVPLESQEGIDVSAPMDMAAMTAAMTVSVTLTNYFLSDANVALIREVGWIQNNDQINIAQQGSFAIGCAQAGLDVLLANAKKRNLCFAEVAYDQLNAELTSLKEATERARLRISEETVEERLSLRAWQIEMAMRCAHAAVASSSGAANSMSHPAQRILREALVFTVSAQTGPIMDATLRRIAKL
jgi:alkylation response protein AidB-like acyl-CoA dehydrogenase